MGTAPCKPWVSGHSSIVREATPLILSGSHDCSAEQTLEKLGKDRAIKSDTQRYILFPCSLSLHWSYSTSGWENIFKVFKSPYPKSSLWCLVSFSFLGKNNKCEVPELGMLLLRRRLSEKALPCMLNLGGPLHPLLTCRGEPVWRECYTKRCLPVGGVSRHCTEVDFPPAPLFGSSSALGALAQTFGIYPFLGECFPRDADLSVNHT